LSEVESLENKFYSVEAKPSIMIGFALMRAYASLNQYKLLERVFENTCSVGQVLKSHQVAQLMAQLAGPVSKDKVTKVRKTLPAAL